MISKARTSVNVSRTLSHSAMDDLMFQVDDDWGSTAKTDYPKLPAKQNASKTVQKRRKRAAKKVLNLSFSAVLPGEA